ncbi:MAG: hypothetical protein E7638_00760 [Ruminococcaceae bacterium]|nr:hypothetical protein [Oscillospiraceae bacterium]
MKGLKKSESIFKNAEFIWVKGLEDTVNAYADFHETLVKKAGVEYSLFITADSDYALYINGVFREGGQYADYPDTYKVYDKVDITDFLTEGENQILITGYCQKEDSSTYREGVGGVMYAFTENDEVILTSGLHTKANKNPHYVSGPVALVSGQLSFSFEYSFIERPVSEKEPFISRSFDTLYERPTKKLLIKDRCAATPLVTGSFRDGVAEGNPGLRMQKAYLGFTSRLRLNECVSDGGIVLKKEENTDGIYVVYDMGREEAGLITLDLTLPCDGEFIVGWGEHLDDLRVSTDLFGRCFAARFDGKAGKNTFIHPFKRSGCRYVAIQIYAPEAKLDYVGITPTDYPTAADVTFRCADRMANEIYDISKRTLLMCMHEHYEDCPWREQALYTMDSRNQMLCGYYAFREFDMPKAAIRLMALSIRDDDLLELCSPARVCITIPCFSAIFAIQLWEYLLYSGDRDFAAEMLPTAERICMGFLNRGGETGLQKEFFYRKYWNFYEWQKLLEGYEKRPETEADQTYDLPLCAFVSMAYQSLAKIYAHLGDDTKAAEWTASAAKLNEAAHRTFYNEKDGYYLTYYLEKSGETHSYHLSQLANALAVTSGICPDGELDRVLENLANNTDLFPVTLSHSIFFYDALMKRPGDYTRFVFDHVSKSYGHMIKNGATTFWETLDGSRAFNYGGSLCHGWSAVPIYLYFRYAAGITPTSPGVFENNPLPEKLTGIYELTIE